MSSLTPSCKLKTCDGQVPQERLLCVQGGQRERMGREKKAEGRAVCKQCCNCWRGIWECGTVHRGSKGRRGSSDARPWGGAGLEAMLHLLARYLETWPCMPGKQEDRRRREDEAKQGTDQACSLILGESWPYGPACQESKRTGGEGRTRHSKGLTWKQCCICWQGIWRCGPCCAAWPCR